MVKKFHTQVELLCFIYWKDKTDKDKSTILNIVLLLLGLKERLAASQTRSILPCSFFLTFHVDSVYLLICVAAEVLWHAAAPPGFLGDMIVLEDFGFLATAVKLHSDDETAVQLCLRLTVGC